MQAWWQPRPRCTLANRNSENSENLFRRQENSFNMTLQIEAHSSSSYGMSSTMVIANKHIDSSTRSRFCALMLLRVDASTSQHIDVSTHRRVEASPRHCVAASPRSCLDASLHRCANASTLRRRVNALTYRYVHVRQIYAP